MKKLSTITTVGTFASTIICFGLIAFFAYTLVNRLQQEHLQNDKKQVLEIAQQALILPLWNYDDAYINEVLSSFIDEKLDTVIGIRLVTIDVGQTYSAKSSKFKLKTFEQLGTTEDVEVLRERIIYRGRNLGTIEIYFSTALFTSSFKEIAGTVLVMTSLMALLLAFIMNYFLRHLLIKPLKEITNEARKTSKGHFNINFKTNYVGELNVVTEAFNDTISALMERDRQLLQNNNELESLVENRTNERDLERLKSFNASRLASLGEMAGAIAHEINNPLTIIQGYSKNLKISLTNMDATDLANKSNKIHYTSERIAKIVKGLQAFSRDGTHDPARPCTAEKLVEDLNSLCLSRTIEKSITLKFDYCPDDILIINTTQIGQVLINLINNAIDAIEKLDEKWINVKIECHNLNTKITVTDSGDGIDETIIPKIMDPFFTTKEFGRGTGLGLSISHSIINQHGGEFFYNQSSDHTQFVINLPQPDLLH